MQPVIGVRKGIPLFEQREVDLLVGAPKGDVVGLASLGFHNTEVFKHHEPACGDDPVWGVGIEDFKEVVSTQRPTQILVGQHKAVVGEVHFGAKTRLVVGHRGGVKPLNVFAGAEVRRLPMPVTVDDAHFPGSVIAGQIVETEAKGSLVQWNDRWGQRLSQRVEEHRGQVGGVGR